MTKQITQLAIMLGLIFFLMAGEAKALEIADTGFARLHFYTGIEITPGTKDISNSVLYGNSFALNSFGEWESHHMNISVDYSINSFVPDDLIVTGGSWSLLIFRENQYAGTLFGEVQSGRVNIIRDQKGNELTKLLRLNLKANGGFGVFGGRNGAGISGEYDMTTDFRSKATMGNAGLEF